MAFETTPGPPLHRLPFAVAPDPHFPPTISFKRVSAADAVQETKRIADIALSAGVGADDSGERACPHRLYVAERTVAMLRSARGSVERAKVPVLGFAFKENVADMRNTRVADIVHALQSVACSVRSSIPKLMPMRLATATGSR